MYVLQYPLLMYMMALMILLLIKFYNGNIIIRTAKEISPAHIYIHVGKGHTHMNAAVTESEHTLCKVYFHTYKFKIENVDTRSHTHCF